MSRRPNQKRDGQSSSIHDRDLSFNPSSFTYSLDTWRVVTDTLLTRISEAIFLALVSAELMIRSNQHFFRNNNPFLCVCAMSGKLFCGPDITKETAKASGFVRRCVTHSIMSKSALQFAQTCSIETDAQQLVLKRFLKKGVVNHDSCKGTDSFTSLKHPRNRNHDSLGSLNSLNS